MFALKQDARDSSFVVDTWRRRCGWERVYRTQLAEFGGTWPTREEAEKAAQLRRESWGLTLVVVEVAG